MQIREMTPADNKSIRNIAFRAWRDTYSSFIPETIQDKVLKEAYSEEEMDRRMKSFVNLVGIIDNEIAGYAFLKGNDEVFLESLYIDPKHQGKGIGKQLLQAGIAHFKKAAKMGLTVYKGNSNLTFYEKLGFSITSEVQGDFFGHPITFIKMEKMLID